MTETEVHKRQVGLLVAALREVQDCFSCPAREYCRSAHLGDCREAFRVWSETKAEDPKTHVVI